MAKRKRRAFTNEFKAQTVRLTFTLSSQRRTQP